MAEIELRNCISMPLEWDQPSVYQRVYELRVDDALLITLAKRGMFSSAYDAWVPGEKWEIRRKGFLGTDFVVLDARGGELATGRTGMFDKTELHTASNGYQWDSTDLCRTQWVWRTLKGVALMTLDTAASTMVLPAAQDLLDLTLLVVLARYLRLLRDDSLATSFISI